MKIIKTLKITSLMALVLGVAIGCSSTSQESGGCTVQGANEAIAAAKAANEKAKAVRNEWRDTADIIAKAEKALADGNCDEAMKLANEARTQAENAVAQEESENQRIGHMFESAAPATGGAGQYSVVKGDNLWKISAKPDIYNNPFQWPLIYKANSSKIKDADLIYPGQVFAINTSPTAAEVDAAVRHAKTRGAWSLGKVEASDKAYLAE
jgi:nucleoid-associated protein YgaU